MAAKSKKYFWLKLKEDFFSKKEIKLLRKVAGGDTHTIIYLKMLLKSLKSDGKLFFEGIADNFVDEIALDIDEEPENVQLTVNYLMAKGLMVEVSKNEADLVSVREMTGSETDAAARMRRLRVGGDRNNVTQQLRSSYTEIEKEIEKETDKELNIESESESELKKKTDANPDDISDYEKLTNIYQNNFGVINQIIAEDINHNLSDYGFDLVEESMRRAVFRQRNYNYSIKILKAWAKNNIKTLEDIKADDKKFNRSKEKEDMSGWTPAERRAGFRDV